MSAIIDELASRVRSQSPSAFASYGFAAQRADAKFLIYNGTPLPYFLLENGGRPEDWRAFALLNRFGSLFELESGRMVALANNANDFPSNPDFVV